MHWARTYIREKYPQYPHAEWFVLSAGIIALFLLLLGATYLLRNDPESIRKEILSVHEDDWVRGDITKAKGVIIVYSDFECPSCDIYHGVLEQLQAETGDDIAIVFRHYPLSAIHPNAELAAYAAEAAGKQGKFFEMHDMLFVRQSSWSKKNDAREQFITFANTLGLKPEQFARDIDDSRIASVIEKSKDEARYLDLKNTPHFFIQGTEIPLSRTYAEFKNHILQAIYVE